MAEQTSEQRAQETQKAYEERKEAAKKKVAEQREAHEKRMAEAPEAGRPTPTQEENDLAALGVHVPEHEPDGSPEQSTEYLYPDQLHRQHKQSEAKKPAQQSGQYQTRTAQPATPKPAES